MLQPERLKERKEARRHGESKTDAHVVLPIMARCNRLWRSYSETGPWSQGVL